MTSYNFGDVVLVPFPFTNQLSGKQRPAVIVSSAAYQSNKPDVIVMALTSQIRGKQTFGEQLLHGWQQAGLPKPSMIKPVITTLEQHLIIRLMGQLSARDRQELRDQLRVILAE